MSLKENEVYEEMVEENKIKWADNVLYQGREFKVVEFDSEELEYNVKIADNIESKWVNKRELTKT